jgi:hypothetical protein
LGLGLGFGFGLGLGLQSSNSFHIFRITTPSFSREPDKY